MARRSPPRKVTYFDGPAALSRPHQSCSSAGRIGSAAFSLSAWLDENCGADGWAMTPSGTRGVLNDAASIYFVDTTLAGAFVARWCTGYRVETAGGVFREDDPAPRVGAGLHRTP